MKNITVRIFPLCLLLALFTTGYVSGADLKERQDFALQGQAVAPGNIHCGALENVNWIGYTEAPETAACCHGNTGPEQAFVLNAIAGWGSAKRIFPATRLSGEFSEFQTWMPCRKSLSIIVGHVVDGSQSGSIKKAPASCAGNQSRTCDGFPKFSAYLVNFTTQRSWTPVEYPDSWESGYIDPWYDTSSGALLGYFLNAKLKNKTPIFYRVSSSGKNPTVVNLTPPATTGNHGCSVARSSLWVACEGNRGGNYPDCREKPCASIEMYEPTDSAGNTFRWVTNMSARLGGLFWSQDGTKGIFISPSALLGAQGEIGIWSSSRPKGSSSFHIRYEQDCQAFDTCPGFSWDSEIPALSPDGRYLYLSLPSPGNANRRVVGRVDISGENSRWEFEPLTLNWRVAGKHPSARFPAISPDGKFVAFLANSEFSGEGKIQLFVMPSDGSGRPRQLTHVGIGKIVKLPVWR